MPRFVLLLSLIALAGCQSLGPGSQHARSAAGGGLTRWEGAHHELLRARR